MRFDCDGPLGTVGAMDWQLPRAASIREGLGYAGTVDSEGGRGSPGFDRRYGRLSVHGILPNQYVSSDPGFRCSSPRLGNVRRQRFPLGPSPPPLAPGGDLPDTPEALEFNSLG